MPTTTTNYGLLKPLVNNATDQDLWGGYLNDDMDDIDGLTKTAINWTPSSATSTITVTAPTGGSTTTGSAKKLYLCDASGGAFAANLPAASASSGMVVAFKKTDSSANAITITCDGSDTIDGASTQNISTQYDTYSISSNGVDAWEVLIKPSAAVQNASTSQRGIIQLATNAEVATATDSVKAVVPSAVNSHPGVAKAWCMYNGTTNTILASHNISSVTDNGDGDFTFNFTVAFSSANYAIQGVSTWPTATSYSVQIDNSTLPSASACRINVVNAGSGAKLDTSRVSVSFFGDQ